MKNKNLFKTLSVVLALIIWQIASIILNANYLLASPIDVIKKLFALMFEDDFLKTVFFSFLRISSGFLIAFVLGFVFAVLAGRFKIIEYLLWPFVITVKAVPIASFIILCLIWLNFNQLTVFIAFLIAFPIIYKNTLEGIKNADNKLIEVTKVYNIPFRRKFLYVLLPSIEPFLISACSVAIGMTWKAGVAAEVIGVVSGSIGGKLYDAKIYFQNADLLAWTIVIVLICVLCEKVFVSILKWIMKGLKHYE